MFAHPRSVGILWLNVIVFELFFLCTQSTLFDSIGIFTLLKSTFYELGLSQWEIIIIVFWVIIVIVALSQRLLHFICLLTSVLWLNVIDLVFFFSFAMHTFLELLRIFIILKILLLVGFIILVMLGFFFINVKIIVIVISVFVLILVHFGLWFIPEVVLVVLGIVFAVLLLLCSIFTLLFYHRYTCIWALSSEELCSSSSISSWFIQILFYVLGYKNNIIVKSNFIHRLS